MAFKHILKRNTFTSKPALDLDDDSTYSTAKALPSKIPVVGPTVKAQESIFGTNAVVKTFYQDHKKGWVETPPKQISTKNVKKYDGVAIKVYKVKDHKKPVIDGKPALRIDVIEIQSPVLVAALKSILEPLGTFLEAHETARLTAPFKPLYFAYDAIMDLYDRTYNETTLKEHLHLFTDLMNELFGAMMTRVRNLRASKLISYDIAWTYFPKDSVVYSGATDCERLYRVLDTEYDDHTDVLKVACEEIAFNGTEFAWKKKYLEIPSFGGNVPVASLSNFPLSFHPNVELLKAKLIARGKLVLDYQELKYREYCGIGNSDDAVSGRVIIDYHGYEKHHKGLQRNSGGSGDGKSAYIEPLSQKNQQKNKDKMLSKQGDLIFMSPMLSGFALKDKVWLHLYVDDIRPVTWNDEAYDHLVYPEEQKDLVLTFVKNHQQTKAGLNDVIAGKGQGLVTLLSGPPGTGKTLLAEAVADKTRRPLYYLQAEELGTNATVLGKNIKKVFEMATEWNAVILLDGTFDPVHVYMEADVFMAERSPSDVLRNELVSIFLRELEYLQGIIFLTTNLLATVDNAFRSRVSIHLLFSPLSAPSRTRLWQKLLSRLPSVPSSSDGAVINLTGSEVSRLAEWELNGREIKNVIKTVRTWCFCKGVQITLPRLESAIAVTAPQARKAGDETCE